MLGFVFFLNLKISTESLQKTMTQLTGQNQFPRICSYKGSNLAECK